MRKSIFLYSLVLAFVVSSIVSLVYVALRNEMAHYFESVMREILRDSLKNIKESILNQLSRDEIKQLVENGDFTKIADMISRRASVHGVKIDGYATPANLPACKTDGDLEGCKDYIVMNIDYHGKKIQVYINMQKLLSKVQNPRYGIYSGGNTEIVKDYNIHVVERRASPKALITLGVIFVLSTYSFYRLLEKFTAHAQSESALIPMVKMMEKRDPYTAGHSKRVARLSRDFAKYLGLKGEKIKIIYKAGLLHDIGKIGIPEKILLKPGKLLPDEFEIVKKHPLLSEEILKGIPGYERIARIVRYHHERCDGSGYPDGLVCDEIPLESKIIAIVDVYDALTSERAYRKSWSPEQALKYIKQNAGKLFDERLADKFVEMMEKRVQKRKVA